MHNAGKKRNGDNVAATEAPPSKKFMPKQNITSQQKKFEKNGPKKPFKKQSNGKGFKVKKMFAAKKPKPEENLQKKAFVKGKRNISEIHVKAKQIYEKLKCRRTVKKDELVKNLYDLLETNNSITKFVMAHDTSRILQCMLKYADPQLRERLSKCLLPKVVDMAMSKYANFCVLRMLKYGSPSTKSEVVDAFMGNIFKLACHNIAHKIIDYVYLTVANEKQKMYMRQEFYSDMYRQHKNDDVKCLKDLYQNTPASKKSILDTIKINLQRLINKDQLLDNSLVHAVFLHYLEESEANDIEELAGLSVNSLPHLLTTKDGCHAALICFYNSPTKNRRAIIKSLKEHVLKCCLHQYGHVFIIAIFNGLDDTKMLKKSLYDVIYPHLTTLLADQWGRRVLHWLVSPADKSYFHSAFISNIEEGLKFSKKDKDLRRQEIYEQIEESLSNGIVDHADLWLQNKFVGLLTAEVLRKLNSTNFVKAASALVEVIADPRWTVEEVDEATVNNRQSKSELHLQFVRRKIVKPTDSTVESVENLKNTKNGTSENTSSSCLGIEDAGLHMILKRIIKNDKNHLESNKDCETFGSLLVNVLTKETLEKWLTVNRACFVLLNIIENNGEKTRLEMQKRIEPLKEQFFPTNDQPQKSNGISLLKKKLYQL